MKPDDEIENTADTTQAADNSGPNDTEDEGTDSDTGGAGEDDEDSTD